MKRNWFYCSLMIVLATKWAVSEDQPAPIKGLSEKVVTGEEPKPKADKSEYNLFKPVPKDLMRELSTDRPDQTESAYTVDAGHFQIETSFFDFSRDRRNAEHDGARADAYTFASTNFKMGLLNNVDLQLVFDPYIVEKDRGRDADGKIFHETKRGFGDFTTRLKINVWGNDGGMTAMAVMPYLKAPTNQDHLGNKNVEGGVILPVAVALPMGFDMAAMTQLDVLRDEGERNYHAESFNSATFGHKVIAELNIYVEFAARVDLRKGSRWQGYTDAGFTYGVTENIQMDIGVNVGVTRPAVDVNPFIGMSVRF
jgi:hypothetical protein